MQWRWRTVQCSMSSPTALRQVSRQLARTWAPSAGPRCLITAQWAVSRKGCPAAWGGALLKDISTYTRTASVKLNGLEMHTTPERSVDRILTCSFSMQCVRFSVSVTLNTFPDILTKCSETFPLVLPVLKHWCLGYVKCESVMFIKTINGKILFFRF